MTDPASKTFLDAYRARVARGQFERDPVQEQAVLRLQALQDELMRRARAGSALRARLRLPSRKAADGPRGLWLWGSVGSGKTSLLDLFHLSLPVPQKRRLHFHRLMHYVHMQRRKMQEQDHPLDLIAADLASRYRIICLDEFFVTDIADAMILSGLLEGLWKRGVALAATSNTHPDRLYEGGLQRERFLPAIERIKARMDIFELAHGIDYRTRRMHDAQTYHVANGADAEQALGRHFEHLAMGHARRDTAIEVEGRQIPVKRLSHDAIWFDFDALCATPRSVNDYIMISRCFGTVLVSGVPVFGEETDDSARRFMHMIDEFYDRNVKLMISAQADPARDAQPGVPVPGARHALILVP